MEFLKIINTLSILIDTNPNDIKQYLKPLNIQLTSLTLFKS